MSILQDVLNTYAQFFNWQMWGEVLTSAQSWSQILVLVVLEGLLSADNALVLALLVSHLPQHMQKKALIYGFAGAVFFRFLFIGLGYYLVSLWPIKLAGAAYLAYLAIDYFRNKGEEEEDEHSFKRDGIWGKIIATIGIFWVTVIQVELTDLAFSIDSILAALAVSDKVWVLLLGGVLGILMMRGVAGIFLKLIEAVPEFKTTAYVLIALISTKMFLGTVHSIAGLFGVEMHEIHINHWLFFSIIVATFLGTFVVHKFNARKQRTDANTAA